MKKKILLSIAAAMLMLNIALPGFASDAEFDYSFKVTYDPDTYYMSGEIVLDNPTENVLFSVRIQDGAGKENYADILKSGKDGRIDFGYYNDGETGIYTARAYAVEEGILKSVEIDYKSAAYWAELINIFNTARKNSNRTALEEFYELYKDALGLEISDMSDMSNDIYTSILKNYKEVGNAASRKDIINEFYAAVFMAKQISGNDGDLFDLICEDKYLQSLKLDVYVPKIDGVSLLEKQSDKIKKEIMQAVAKKKYSTIEELRRDLSDQILLAVVKLADSYADVKNTVGIYFADGKLDSNIIGKTLSGNNSVYKALVGRSFSSVAELQTAYNKAVSDAAAEGNRSSSGGGGGGGGGSVAVNAPMSVNPAQAAASPEPAEAASGKLLNPTDIFEDISEFNWALKHIEKVYKSGIMNGTDENKFAPDKNLTRAESAAILVRAAGVGNNDIVEANISFKDVTKDKWYYNDVMRAYENGLMNGISDDEFSPEALITREDFSCVIWRILKNYVEENNFDIAFDDKDEIADYAADSIKNMVFQGILNGKSTALFCPKDNIMRVEAAAIISRMLDKIGEADKNAE